MNNNQFNDGLPTDTKGWKKHAHTHKYRTRVFLRGKTFLSLCMVCRSFAVLCCPKNDASGYCFLSQMHGYRAYWLILRFAWRDGIVGCAWVGRPWEKRAVMHREFECSWLPKCPRPVLTTSYIIKTIAQNACGIISGFFECEDEWRHFSSCSRITFYYLAKSVLRATTTMVKVCCTDRARALFVLLSNDGSVGRPLGCDDGATTNYTVGSVGYWCGEQ